jgi:hypothetical protein
LDDRIFELKDLEWPWTGNPNLYTHKLGDWRKPIAVDPFPCHPHERDDVLRMVERVEKAFPIGFKPDYFLLHFETMERTNGWADKVWFQSEEDPQKRLWKPYIVLSGKRIPIHPAMTRYLIPHEYGHIVEDWIEHVRGMQVDRGVLRAEYAEMRGIETPKTSYGGHSWAVSPGEVLANDFRICVVGAESEFWPHKGIKHPLRLPHVIEYWEMARREWAS